jgi:hypothetical protein
VRQAAAPLGKASRSAGSLLGQSDSQASRFGGCSGLEARVGSPKSVVELFPAWRGPAEARQAAAPLGKASRSAGSLLGQSDSQASRFGGCSGLEARVGSPKSF